MTNNDKKGFLVHPGARYFACTRNLLLFLGFVLLLGGCRTSEDSSMESADITPPVINITSPNDGTTLNVVPSFTITGKATDDRRVESVTIDVNGVDVPAVFSDNQFSAQVDFTGNEAAVTVTAQDAAGNTSSAQMQVLFVDTTPPIVTIETPINGEMLTDTHEFILEGSVADGSRVLYAKVKVNNIERDLILNDNNFSQALSFRGGTADVTVSAYDLAGHQGESSVTVDYTGPVTVCNGDPAFDTAVDSLDPYPDSFSSTDIFADFWHADGKESFLLIVDGRPYAYDSTTLEPSALPFMNSAVLEQVGKLVNVYHDDANGRTLFVSEDGVSELPDGSLSVTCLVKASDIDNAQLSSEYTVISRSAYDAATNRLFVFLTGIDLEVTEDEFERIVQSSGRLINIDLPSMSVTELKTTSRFIESSDTGFRHNYHPIVDIAYSTALTDIIYLQYHNTFSDISGGEGGEIWTGAGMKIESNLATEDARIAVDSVRHKLFRNYANYEYDLPTLQQEANPNLPDNFLWAAVNPDTGLLWSNYGSNTEVIQVTDLTDGATQYVDMKSRTFSSTPP